MLIVAILIMGGVSVTRCQAEVGKDLRRGHTLWLRVQGFILVGTSLDQGLEAAGHITFTHRKQRGGREREGE